MLCCDLRDPSRRLVELNTKRQVFNVCTAPAVQAAWAKAQELSVHGFVYSLADGLLHVSTLTSPCVSPIPARSQWQ